MVFCDFFFPDASHVELGEKETVKAALCYVFPETQDTDVQASWVVTHGSGFRRPKC